MQDKCFECDTTEDLQQHHVVPRSRGGTKTVTLCHSCHMKAHGRDSKGLNHSRLVREAQQRKKETGYIPGKPPYGYKHNADRTKLLPVEEEQKVIKWVKWYREKGDNWRVITEKLNEQGFRTRKGKKWYKSHLYKILHWDLKNRRNNGRES